MKRLFFLLIITGLLGCAPITAALKGINNDPKGYSQGSKNITTGINLAFPETKDAPLWVGVGYLINFARRVYVEGKKKKAANKT